MIDIYSISNLISKSFMKDISSLVPNVSNDFKQEIIEPTPPPENINTITDIPDEIVISDYMVRDSNFVGYESIEQQEQIYRMSTYGILSPLLPGRSVLDLGAGRGDLGSFISRVIDPRMQYNGVDVNKLMIDIGNQKNSERDTFQLNQLNYFDLKGNSEKYPNLISDWVFNVTNLTIPYGYHNGDKMEQFNDLLDISLEYSIIGAVFMLINTRSEFDGYYQYNTADIINILESRNLKYAIDNTDLRDIFKLVIFKQNF